jgi:ribosomal protein S13
MNGKHLLIVAFATAFSGINLVASEEVSVETTIVKIKTFKAIADKQIRRHCREVNSDLCQELELLMATTDSIDLEKANDILSSLREELHSHSILKGILEDVNKAVEVITENSEKSE